MGNPTATTKRACGNPICGASTGICGRITFGTGRLDDFGYWENGCRTCAAEYTHRTGKEAWPTCDKAEHVDGKGKGPTP